MPLVLCNLNQGELSSNHHTPISVNDLPDSTFVLSYPDVASLEDWEHQAYLVATYSMPMALDHSVIADLHQRARESGQLSQWQEEGNIVERWAKRCEAAGGSDPARGAWGGSSGPTGLKS